MTPPGPQDLSLTAEVLLLAIDPGPGGLFRHDGRRFRKLLAATHRSAGRGAGLPGAGGRARRAAVREQTALQAPRQGGANIRATATTRQRLPQDMRRVAARPSSKRGTSRRGHLGEGMGEGLRVREPIQAVRALRQSTALIQAREAGTVRPLRWPSPPAALGNRPRPRQGSRDRQRRHVDVSREDIRGAEAHSGESVMRGELGAEVLPGERLGDEP